MVSNLYHEIGNWRGNGKKLKVLQFILEGKVCARVCVIGRSKKAGLIGQFVRFLEEKKIQTNKKLFNLKTDDQEIGLEMLGEGRDRAVRRGRDATEEKI